MSPVLAVLLIALTYAAEVLIRAWHLIPRTHGVFA